MPTSINAPRLPERLSRTWARGGRLRSLGFIRKDIGSLAREPYITGLPQNAGWCCHPADWLLRDQGVLNAAGLAVALSLTVSELARSRA